MYDFPPSNSSSGSGSVKQGGVYVGSSARPLEWLIGRDHTSRFCSARASRFSNELGEKVETEGITFTRISGPFLAGMGVLQVGRSPH